jgi:hypothetical protein
MKYVGNPVEVDAFKIVSVGPLADRGGNFRILTLEDGKMVQADEGMMSRMTPEVDDYWVIQSDGYIYLNPKDVFERKYRPYKGMGAQAASQRRIKMIIWLSLLIAVIGVLMYALSANPKIAEIGRIMFWVGLLCFLFGDQAIVHVLQR